MDSAGFYIHNEYSSEFIISKVSDKNKIFTQERYDKSWNFLNRIDYLFGTSCFDIGGFFWNLCENTARDHISQLNCSYARRPVIASPAS